MTSETKTGVVRREPAVGGERAAPRFEDDELAQLDAYIASFSLEDDEHVSAIRDRVIAAAHQFAESRQYRIQRCDLVATAERLIADWTAECLGGSTDDDHLLTLRLRLALSGLGRVWNRSEFLSSKPSAAFLDDLKAAMPDATPSEEPAPMPNATYERWTASDITLPITMCFRAVSRALPTQWLDPFVTGKNRRRQQARDDTDSATVLDLQHRQKVAFEPPNQIAA